MEIQIMKIYDMIEGKWLKSDKLKEKKKKDKERKDLIVVPRLVSYEEEVQKETVVDIANE